LSDQTQSAATAADQKANYEPDAIYQEGKIVARVLSPDFRAEAREIYFGELNTCDDLILPEECEFQKYRLMIQRIEYAARTDKANPEKGRVLRGVVAEILGYREQ
jgi:hypothetical protein